MTVITDVAGTEEPEPASIPESRIAAIISWLRENEATIERMRKGSIEIHCSGNSLTFSIQRHDERKLKIL